ncbi:hypothetical protein APY04_0150 [Hyphomicrobium sulfonivorans]|uniref:Uncharacterized protein n=1 Tax=Hyphomicrobium sulfonivorans TaxID=121290 RepID=A0A109BP23_HYPSL|nr:hypothetical protein APY04_0150 [Hyphomicrobium sulfonivorans]
MARISERCGYPAGAQPGVGFSAEGETAAHAAPSVAPG